MTKVTQKREDGRQGQGRPEGRTQACSEDGVDLTLIRWMLSVSPLERLRILQCNVASIMRLRGETSDS